MALNSELPENTGIRRFIQQNFCNSFWMTVKNTIKIENCLYLEFFLKSIEHIRKIRKYVQKIYRKSL